MKVQYIGELLYRHECVIVPGFGGFITSYLPARIDKEANRFFPPSCKVAFNESLSANDGILANHISKAELISYREAIDDIRRWVEHTVRSLNSHGSLKLETLGTFSLNSEGNIQFEPETGLNYLGNSFGLPSFVSPVVVRKEENKGIKNTERVQGWPARLIPETLKWAAVLAPFIAFTLWGTMNVDRLDNYVHNYSGFYSWVKSTPGKTAVSKSTINDIQVPATIIKKVESPGSLLNESLVQLSPAVISYNAFRNTDAKLVSVENQISEDQSGYFIIGGAFREHSNALKMIEELKSKGYPASIIDTTSKGMYIVGIRGFGTRLDALSALPGIKDAGYTGAWIMRKK
jgi:nucleoid DNA-binding protein